MGLKKVTAEEMSNLDTKAVREPGWYSLALTKTTLGTSKATQAMGRASFKVCSEEANPDSATGNPIDYLVMFPDIEDEAEFAQSVANKTGLTGDQLEHAIAERIRMAKQGARNFALAMLGTEEFPEIPRWDREAKVFRLEDGTETDKAGKDLAYDARNAEAYNAAVEIFEGTRDVTRWVVYGKLDHQEFNGQTQETIKSLRATLPEGESLVIG